jgi:hypothetical protein
LLAKSAFNSQYKHYDPLILLQSSLIMTFLQSHGTRVELTPPELLDISLAISREFAPRFHSHTGDRRFSAQELLSISQEIARDFTPHRPEQHNSLVIMPVDPQHLHVYWQIADAGTPPQQPLALRLYPELAESETSTATAQPEPPVCWQEYVLEPDQHDLQLTLPVATTGAYCYQAAIGSVDENQEFAVYLHSNSATMPASPQPLTHTHLPDQLHQYLIPVMAGSSPTGAANICRES